MSCSCAHPSPQFATSLKAPTLERAVARPAVEPAPSRLRLIPSQQKAEDITRKFFLHLSTGDFDALETTLDASAMLLEGEDTSRHPAASRLAELYASLRGRTSQPAREGQASPMFAPLRVMQVKQNLITTTVDVFVSSPREVHGLWVLTMRNGAPGLPISIITLPQTK